MARILLVEDDERQITWAKQCLSGHNLTVFTTTSEFYDSEIYDGLKHKSIVMEDTLLLTDLHLPHKTRETPNPKEGLGLFLSSLKWLACKQLKGLALLSNFEHHIHKESMEILVEGQLEVTKRIVYHMGKKISFKWHKDFIWGDLTVDSFGSEPLNMLIMHDSTIIEGYTDFMSPEGKILNREELIEQFGYDEQIELVVKAGYLNLKPFSFIVEALLT